MLNKAVIMGRLTAEPELKHTQSNTAVVSFTVAVERTFSGKDGNKETDFLDVVAWRNTAEFISKYFAKGQMIVISGAIQTRNWEDKEGKKRKSVEIIADEVFFGEGKKSTGPEAVKVDEGFTQVQEGDPELPF